LECVFCKIISGQIPAAKIYESDKIISFLDISPANKGHVLIVPKRHYDTIFEIDERDLRELAEAIKRVSSAVAAATHASGINILSNIGEDAGQVIKHFHIHIIPRFKGDGISFEWKSKKYEEGEMENLRKRIKEFL
jgi:histidine triad (HIT) family protein